MGSHAYDSANDTFDDIAGIPRLRLNRMESNLTSVYVTGTTNNTGSTITKGKFFYFNGVLAQAKVDIAANATLTLNTNYELPTAGGLNALMDEVTSLKSSLNSLQVKQKITTVSNFSGTAIDTTIDMAETGLEFIGVVGFYLSGDGGYMSWRRCAKENDTVNVSLVSYQSLSNRDLSIQVRGLYIAR